MIGAVLGASGFLTGLKQPREPTSRSSSPSPRRRLSAHRGSGARQAQGLRHPPLGAERRGGAQRRGGRDLDGGVPRALTSCPACPPASFSEHGPRAGGRARHGRRGRLRARRVVLLVRGNQLIRRGAGACRRYRTPMRVAYLLYLGGLRPGHHAVRGDVWLRAGGRPARLPEPPRAPDPQVPLHSCTWLRRCGKRATGRGSSTFGCTTSARSPLGGLLFVGLTAMSGPQVRYGSSSPTGCEPSGRARPSSGAACTPRSCPNRPPRTRALMSWSAAKASCPRPSGRRARGRRAIERSTASLRAGGAAERLRSRRPLHPRRHAHRSRRHPGGAGLRPAPAGSIPTLQAGRVHLQTSRGCPSRCGFCYNTVFNKRRWRGKSPERVVDEMERLTRRFPGRRSSTLWTTTSSWTGGARRASARRSQPRPEVPLAGELPVRLPRELRRRVPGSPGTGRMHRARFRRRERVGAHAGLRLQGRLRGRDPDLRGQAAPLGAGHRPVRLLAQRPPRRLRRHGEDLRPHGRHGQANPRTQHYGIFLYTPFPSPLLDELPPEFAPPRSLEEWGDIEVFHFLPPWHSPEYVERLRAISAVTRWAFYPRSRIDEHGRAFKAAYGTL